MIRKIRELFILSIFKIANRYDLSRFVNVYKLLVWIINQKKKSQIIYTMGVDRCVDSIPSVKDPNLQKFLVESIGSATKSIDPVLEIRAAKRANLKLALKIAGVLIKAKKYNAAKWWIDRIDDDERHLMMVEILAGSNKFFELEEYLDHVPTVPPLVRGRALCEIGLRSKRKEILNEGIELLSASYLRKRTVVYAWLRAMLCRSPTLPVIFDEQIIKHILSSSERVERRVDYIKLAALLRPLEYSPKESRGYTYLRGLENSCSRGDFETALALATNPPANSWKNYSPAVARANDRRLAAVSAVGGPVRSMAEGIAAQVFASGNVELIRNSFEQLISYAPTSSYVLEMYRLWALEIGWSELSSLCQSWQSQYCKDQPWPARRSHRCFIVANGPSINEMPLNLLRGEDIFIMNRGYEALNYGLPKPRFIVVADPHVYKDYKQGIDNCDVDKRFIAGRCILSAPRPLPQKTMAIGVSTIFLSRLKLTHSSECFHPGSSVLLIACQIAQQMGYTEINIMGADLDYTGDRMHFYGNGAKEARRLGAFRDGGAGVAALNTGMRNVAAVLSQSNVQLWNVGRGGNLTVLPRRDFESLF